MNLDPAAVSTPLPSFLFSTSRYFATLSHPLPPSLGILNQPSSPLFILPLLSHKQAGEDVSAWREPLISSS